MHVQRARTLDDPLHRDPPPSAETTIAARGSPAFTNDAEGRAQRQQSGVPARAPTPALSPGSPEPRGSRRRRAAGKSSAGALQPTSLESPFSPRRGGGARHDDLSE